MCIFKYAAHLGGVLVFSGGGGHGGYHLEIVQVGIRLGLWNVCTAFVSICYWVRMCGQVWACAMVLSL